MKLLNRVTAARQATQNPLGYLSDILVKLVINLIVPIPLAGELATALKTPILGFLGTLVILGLFMLITVGALIFSPALVSSTFLDSILTPTRATTIPVGSFTQTSIPIQTPLGGSGLEYVTITAGFKEPGYFLQFGKVHFGIDFVPNNAYYSSTQTYKDTGHVIIYATHSGKIRSYLDEYGSKTVEVENADNKLKTIYMHMREVYILNEETAQAGTPLGEMGKTGFATAEHIHYEIRIKDGNNWLPVNPLTYIQ